MNETRGLLCGISSNLNENNFDCSLTPWVNHSGRLVFPCNTACTLFCKEVRIPGTCREKTNRNNHPLTTQFSIPLIKPQLKSNTYSPRNKKVKNRDQSQISSI